MKVRLEFKYPDVIDMGLSYAGITEDMDEWDTAQDVIRKWVRYSEYVTIEVDLVTGEAIVVPVK